MTTAATMTRKERAVIIDAFDLISYALERTGHSEFNLWHDAYRIDRKQRGEGIYTRALMVENFVSAMTCPSQPLTCASGLAHGMALAKVLGAGFGETAKRADDYRAELFARILKAAEASDTAFRADRIRR
jgi:hypothetical protein